MSNVYFISDLHLGHKNILKFEPNLRFGTTVDEHDYTLIERIRCVASSKRDTLFILGDVCFEMEKIKLLDTVSAKKILVRGNHDMFDDMVYYKYFEKILGISKYKRNFWLTHAPVHPAELRGCKNIHGHVHRNGITEVSTGEADTNYINVCVEACQGYPVNFEDIRDGHYTGEIK